MAVAIRPRPDSRSPRSAPADECSVDITPNGRVRVRTAAIDRELHPMWLRERCRSVTSIDRANGQRLVEPGDLPEDLRVVGLGRSDGADELVITFSDGHCTSLPLPAVVAAMFDTGEDPPLPTPWTARDLGAIPIFDYDDLELGGVSAAAARREVLAAFFELGFFVLRGAPAEPGALHVIAGHFGRISATNFGTLFDVRTEAVPVDLAYTPVALSAHTDQPYRAPAPGLQFLHTIVNEAPGGASIVVDGLAGVDALAAADPEAHEVLCSLPVEFRYDIGSDVKLGRAPIIDRRRDGSLRQFRFSPRLDFAPAVAADVLDVFYRGRRWLAEWFDDPTHRVEYRMVAGDVLVVDNHRVLHGRTSFDPAVGNRHLQGCYIDHDGPITEWILAGRQLAGRSSEG